RLVSSSTRVGKIFIGAIPFTVRCRVGVVIAVSTNRDGGYRSQ
ncbi:MAG: hypothetical protein QOG75_3952, partial [Mycobacterium sp.]|nr:hypothetical protein [Mycobacterium sp.]